MKILFCNIESINDSHLYPQSVKTFIFSDKSKNSTFIIAFYEKSYTFAVVINT